MGESTIIAWTDHTWNPWRGCTQVSPGCAHCYMFTAQRRYGQDPEVVVRTKTWRNLRLKAKAAGTAFFFKQSAALKTETGIYLDGQIVREYPQLATEARP